MAHNPFKDEDLEKLLKLEKSTASNEGWSFVDKSDECEVWKKTEKDQPVQLIKGFLHFKDIPPNTVVDIVHDVESRTKWDKHFPVIEVLETHEHYRVVYWETKMPTGVTNRDLVQNICSRYDEATNTTYFMYHNTTHPSKPEDSRCVRAETILSGVIVRPDPNDPKSTSLSILLQTDMKGWIPHMISNTSMASAPGEWQKDLTNYYWNVYSKQQK